MFSIGSVKLREVAVKLRQYRSASVEYGLVHFGAGVVLRGSVSVKSSLVS